MSRRHHGRPHYEAHRTADGGRRAAGVSPSPAPSPFGGPPPGPGGDVPRAVTGPVPRPPQAGPVPRSPQGEVVPRPLQAEPVLRPSVPLAEGPLAEGPPADHVDPASPRPINGASLVAPGLPAHPGLAPTVGGADRSSQCTAPQLRRFIKSRPYIPMHELRRRFGIDGGDDDVTPVRLEPGWVYVGLPSREGSLLGDLLRNGEIGYELSLDPRTPIVIGVYPMRPIPRG